MTTPPTGGTAQLTLPANVNQILVRGTFLDFSGKPYPSGSQVKFAPSPATVIDSSAKTIIGNRTPLVSTLGTDGYFEQWLPASDDPDVTPTGWTYQVVEPTGRSYPITVPLSTPLVQDTTDPHYGQPVIELSDVVPVDAPNPGTALLLRGRGVWSMAVATNNHLIVTYDDQSTQDAGAIPVTTIRQATDYDNSVAPTDGQALAWSATTSKFHPITLATLSIRGATDYDNTTAPTANQAVAWNATTSKFHPTTVSLPGHTHAGTDVTSGLIGFSYLPTGTTSATVAVGNHTHAPGGYTTTCPAVSAGGSWVVTHNLGSRYVICQVAETASPYDYVQVRIERTTTNTVTVLPDVAMTAGQYEIMIYRVA